MQILKSIVLLLAMPVAAITGIVSLSGVTAQYASAKIIFPVTAGEVSVTSVTAQQRDAKSGLVDISVTMECVAEDVADVECSFVAINNSTKNAISVRHLTPTGADSGSGTSWTRKFVWDAVADVGAAKIENVELSVDACIGVRLWENGPSWAKYNVGATKPEECGYYFWWGDTVGYKRVGDGWDAIDRSRTGFSFAEGGCQTYDKDTTYLQNAGYIGWFENHNLVAKHDAATAHLRTPWRMPTDSEFSSLINNCTTTWTTRNGVNGRLIAGKGAYSSKSVFLPAAGYGQYSFLSFIGSDGFYWSSTPSSDNSSSAHYLRFASSSFYRSYESRARGYPVRPVREFTTKNAAEVGVTTCFVLDCSGVEYDVVFDANGGTCSVSSIPYIIETALGTLPVATRSGYTFNGWYTAARGGTEVSGSTVVTGGMTLYAHWTQNNYTVEFDANGGSCLTSSKQYMSGTVLGTLPTATRRGYAFNGWYTAGSGGMKVSDSTMVTANMILYAHWVTLFVPKVEVNHRDARSGLVDIVVTMEGWTGDVSNMECTFAATNGATKAAIPVEHITQEGADSDSDNVWVRKYVWDAVADIGAAKIADVVFTIDVSYGIQLWKDGPCWARCNVGSSLPENCGYYFWWGGTVGYERVGDRWNAVDGSRTGFSFSDWNCPTCGKDNSQLQSAGYIDSTENLVAAHDAATANLGAPWRMPMEAEFAALVDNCKTTWTTCNGVTGLLVTGKSAYSSKSIFFPGADTGLDFGFEGNSYGSYWNSTPYRYDSGDAFCFVVADFGSGRGGSRRYCGMPVRPVREFSEEETVFSCATLRFTLDCSAADCDVIFEANGGLCTTSSKLCAGGSMLGELPTATRDGYAFDGWYTAASGGVKVTESTKVTGDMTLYARWLAIYTVTFNAAGGECSFVSNRYTRGSRLGQLPEAAFDWRTFEGWYTAAKGGEAVSETTLVTRDVTYYAHWGNYGKQVVDGVEWTFVVADGEAQVGDDWDAAIPTAMTGVVTIPATLGGYPVRRIGDYAFSGCSGLISVTIPEGITSIGSSAFDSCRSLKSITFPSTLEYLGDYVFGGWEHCESLRVVYYCSQIPPACGNDIYIECPQSLISYIPWKPSTELWMNRPWMQWTPPAGGTGTGSTMTCTVAFNANGGLCSSLSKSYVSSSELGTLPLASRSGYTFDGWYTAASGGTKVTSSTVVSKSMTLYAHWTRDVVNCTVTFYAAGGSSSATSKSYASGSKLGTLPSATRSGYTFDGWYTAAIGGTMVTEETVVAEDVAFYAHWTQVVTYYTVIFNANGGSCSTSSMSCASGKTLGTLPTATRNGYMFDGWYTSSSGGSKVTSSMMVTGNATYYAHWMETPVKSRLEISDDGGCFVEKGEELASDFLCFIVYADFPAAIKVTGLPSGLGYRVSNEEPHGDYNNHYYVYLTGKVKQGGVHQITCTATDVQGNVRSDTVSLVLWIDNVCEVYFDVDDDGMCSEWLRWAEPGQTLGTLPTATREGYVLEGWYTAKTGGTKVTAVTVVTKSMTLYAHWKKSGGGTDPAIECNIKAEYRTKADVGVIPVKAVNVKETVKIAVKGLPSGVKFTAKDIVDKKTKKVTVPANSIYGTPTKSGVYAATVTVTPTDRKSKMAPIVKGLLFVVRNPGEHIVRADCDAAQGTVKGMGVYAKGKKVTLKATAAKGWVFNGWYNDKGALIAQAASWSFTMQNKDVKVSARFVTVAADKKSIALAVTAGGKDIVKAKSITVKQGMYVEWPVAASALSAMTVKVSGLPSGLKFTAKDVKATKTSAAVPANTIYGTPKTASKVDKDGKVTPSKVKITVTTAGKAKQEYVLNVTVRGIPAEGTFNGGMVGSGASLTSGRETASPLGGLVTLTVAKTGKISGKYLADGKTWTLSAAGFDSWDDHDRMTAALTAKSGKEVKTVKLTYEDGYVCASLTSGQETASPLFEAWRNEWKDEPLKTLAATLKGKKVQVGEVLLTVGSNGAVTAKGTFGSYSASCSTVLIPTGSKGTYVVYLYFPPKAGKFDGFTDVVEIAPGND